MGTEARAVTTQAGAQPSLRGSEQSRARVGESPQGTPVSQPDSPAWNPQGDHHGFLTQQMESSGGRCQGQPQGQEDRKRGDGMLSQGRGE